MFNFGYGFCLSSERKNKMYLESSIEADKTLYRPWLLANAAEGNNLNVAWNINKKWQQVEYSS